MNQKLTRDPKDRERSAVKVSRDFDFPRELVFSMLTDPKKGAVTWSPEDAVNLVFELDPRPGGAIRIHDRDREGNVHKTSGTVVEIAAPELLVVKTATTPSTGTAPWEALQTLRFEELSPTRTRVTILVKVLKSGSFPGAVGSLEAGFQGGWGEVMDKLMRALSREGYRVDSHGAEHVKIARIYDFPREAVFEMWTDPRKLAKWWGPEGCVVVLSEVDPRPGGAIRVDQRFTDGQIRRMDAIFEKVVPPELLVFRNASPGEAGFSAWEAVDTVTFEELGPRRTRVTAVTTIVRGPQKERESLKEAYKAGWGESFDKLQKALH